MVNTEQNFDQAFEQLCSYVEPTVLIVRPGGCADAAEKRLQIVEQLKAEKGFIELKVFQLIEEETARNTEIGREINVQNPANKDSQQDIDLFCIVKMLKKIIFAGLESRDKFILTDFPDTIKQAEHFEKECAKISAVIFAAGGDASNRIEIINNGLSVESIDSLMQKDYRLKAMRAWDEATFNEHLGSRTSWGLIAGGPLSGKSLVSKIVAENTKGKVVDMIAMADAVRPTLDTEEGPFEGRVPDAEVEKRVLAMVEADKQAGDKFFYLFDGRYHETV